MRKQDPPDEKVEVLFSVAFESGKKVEKLELIQSVSHKKQHFSVQIAEVASGEKSTLKTLENCDEAYHFFVERFEEERAKKARVLHSSAAQSNRLCEVAELCGLRHWRQGPYALDPSQHTALELLRAVVALNTLLKASDAMTSEKYSQEVGEVMSVLPSFDMKRLLEVSSCLQWGTDWKLCEGLPVGRAHEVGRADADTPFRCLRDRSAALEVFLLGDEHSFGIREGVDFESNAMWTSAVSFLPLSQLLSVLLHGLNHSCGCAAPFQQCVLCVPPASSGRLVEQLSTGETCAIFCECLMGRVKDEHVCMGANTPPAAHRVPFGFDTLRVINAAQDGQDECRPREYYVMKEMNKFVVRVKYVVVLADIAKRYPERSVSSGVRLPLRLPKGENSAKAPHFSFQAPRMVCTKTGGCDCFAGAAKIVKTVVKAHLIDLVAEVTVLQQLQNPEDFPLKNLQYTMLLSKGCAVTQMEAYFRSHAIRGVVRAKDVAREGFREATEGGHCAALIEKGEDETEEGVPFRVALGNIPAKGAVTMKIVFVMELPRY